MMDKPIGAIPHPHQKRRSMVKQCEDLITGQVMKLGVSRHQDKMAARLSPRYKEITAYATGSHAIAQQTGIYSGGTIKTYLAAWCQLAKYVKAEFGLKDIRDIQGEHVAAFLETKIVKGVLAETVDTMCSALEKMALAIQLEHGGGFALDWHPEIADAREEAAAMLDSRVHINRAYRNPDKTIEALAVKEHRLAASLQLEGGARVREIALLGSKNLLGNNRIQLFNCKGSENRIMEVSAMTYERLRLYVEKNEYFRIHYKDYISDIQFACIAAGEDYTGSHAFRYCFAQRKYREFCDAGMTELEARYHVSELLGHHRADITKLYSNCLPHE